MQNNPDESDGYSAVSIEVLKGLDPPRNPSVKTPLDPEVEAIMQAFRRGEITVEEGVRRLDAKFKPDEMLAAVADPDRPYDQMNGGKRITSGCMNAK